MVNKNNLTKLISTALIGGIVLTTGGLVLARSGTSTQIASPKSGTTKAHGGFIHQRGGFSNQPLKATLDSLVKAGTITQDTSDKLVAYLNNKQQEMKTTMQQKRTQKDKTLNSTTAKTTQPPRSDIFTNAIKDNVITQAQADAIKQAMATQQSQARNTQMQNKLNTLVAAGTLTQDQANKIIAYIEELQTDRASAMQNLKSMTQEQRKTYMTQNKNTSKEPLAQLVIDGVITQTQSDSVKSAIYGEKRQVKNTKPQDRLSTLVSAGTITQEQADKVTAYLKQLNIDRSTAMKNLKSTTQEQRKAYMAQNKNTNKDPLAQLVTDGVITQAQSDSIKTATMHRTFKK